MFESLTQRLVDQPEPDEMYRSFKLKNGKKQADLKGGACCA